MSTRRKLNQENIDTKVEELLDLPAEERYNQAQLIQTDLKGYVRDNFNLTEAQNSALTKWNENIANYAGRMIADGIRSEDWKINTVRLKNGNPDDPETAVVKEADLGINYSAPDPIEVPVNIKVVINCNGGSES